jgi:AraC-like DNA-binding protein
VPNATIAAIPFSFTQRYRPVLALLHERGIDVAAVLAEVGLNEAELLAPGHRMPREKVVLLSQRLMALCADPEVGLLAAERSQLPDLGLLGYLMRHSSDASQAIEQMARYSRLIADAAECSITRRAGQLLFIGRLAAARPMIPEAVDFTAGVIVLSLRTISEGRALPLQVRLPRPQPERVEPYRKLFGAAVSFGAPCVSMSYAERDLRAPLPDRDPQLLAFLEQRARDLLATLPAVPTLIQQLHLEIGRRLPLREHSISHVCAALGMSERTLRRRLDQDGWSYRELLDNVRRERALLLVGRSDVSLGEIATQSGFDDATGFARAFRRWTGQAPSEYARSAKAGAETGRLKLPAILR